MVATLALWPAGCARRPALHQVVMRAVQYQPSAITAAVGDTVEWVNRDLVPHTSTAAGGRWDSKVVPPNESWRTVMTAAGVQTYSCTIHPTMQGRITVR